MESITTASDKDLTQEQISFTQLADDVNKTQNDQGMLYVLQAVAGSGKTFTVSRLISRVMINKEVTEMKLMSSLRTSAAAAREAIAKAFEDTGLTEQGVVFPTFCIRTIHSLALEQQKFAGAPCKIVMGAKTFISDAVDEIALEERLLKRGWATVEEAWEKLKGKYPSDARDPWAKHHNKVIEAIEKKAESTAQMVSMFVHADAAGEGEKLFAEMGFSPTKDRDGMQLTTYPTHEDVVNTVDVIRTEVLNRGLDTDPLLGAVKLAIKLTEDKMNAASGSVDFTQLIRRFARAGCPVVGQSGVLLVDEAQDLTDSQLCVVKTTLAAGATVFLIGDASQGICSFAGAAFNPIGECMEWAMEQGMEVKTIGLTQNFRSTCQIIRASEAVLPEEDCEIRGDIKGMPGGEDYEAPSYTNFETKDQEQQHVAAKIIKLIKAGVKPGDIAVLRFKNWNFMETLPQALLKSNLPEKIKIKILGTVGSGSLFSEKLASAFRVAMGTEDMEDLFEQTKMLQVAARALFKCNFPDDLATIVREVAEVKMCTPEEVVFNHSDEVLGKARESMLVGSKRNADGDTQVVANCVKYLKTTRHALKTLRLVLVRMMDDKDDCQMGKLATAPPGLPFRKIAPPPANLRRQTTTLGKVVRHFLIHQCTDIKPDHVDDLNNILARFDVALDDGAMLAETIDTIVDTHMSAISGKHEEESIVFSTGHKFKGRQRARVFCMDMGLAFDYIRVDQNKLAAYGTLKDSKAEADLEQAAITNATKERQRLAHVMLSRPRWELHVSGSKGGCTMKAFSNTGFTVRDIA